MAGTSEFNPEHILSHKFFKTTYSYTERDAAIYALGVGARAKDAVDADELKYVYHENGQKFIKVLPTFAALLSLASVPNGFGMPGLEYDPRLLLHRQQYIELYKPFPPCGHVKLQFLRLKQEVMKKNLVIYYA